MDGGWAGDMYVYVYLYMNVLYVYKLTYVYMLVYVGICVYVYKYITVCFFMGNTCQRHLPTTWRWVKNQTSEKYL